MIPAPSSKRHALSVDLEEYFSVENLTKTVPRRGWEALPLRSEAQTEWLLECFEGYRAKATFFVLGWLAKRVPQLVRRIQAHGHEVAAHSYWHEPVYSLTPEGFREDLRRVRKLLEDTTGQAIVGYRAPSFSFTRKNPWVYELLADEGFEYSSSVFPIVHDRYGIPEHPRFPIKVPLQTSHELWEFPMTTVRWAGRNWPVAGGGYLRFLPASLIARALEHVGRNEGPTVLYLHPWEIDPEIPKYRQGFLRDVRGYTGLSNMKNKLECLLSRLSFQPVREVLRSYAAQGERRCA